MKLRKYLRKVSAAALAIAITVVFGACGNVGAKEAAAGQAERNGQEGSGQEKGTGKVVRLGYLPITHALALLEEKELLDGEKGDLTVELEKFSAWTDLMDALNSGRIDGASVLLELAMGAVSQGIDLKVAALGHKDGNVVVVSDQVQSAADLKGKKFAIPHTQSSHNILLNEVLGKGGLKAEDVSVVQLSPSEMPSSLASGVIDGYCVAEPFGAQAVNQGFGHVLYHSEELWEDSLCCGLVLNGGFLEENQEAADKLIEKYYEAGKALDLETAKEVAGKYLGQDETALELSLQWIQFDDLAVTEEAYQSLADKVKAYGINGNPPAFEDFVYKGE